MFKGKTKIRFVNFQNQTVFIVGKFSILWNVFEYERCQCDCSPEKIQRAVRNVTEDCKDAFRKFAIVLNKRARRSGNSGDIENYVATRIYQTSNVNARPLGPSRLIQISSVTNFIESYGNSNLDGGLLAILRIRNNMFHGLKEYADLENQVELFESMCDVLELVLDDCIYEDDF